MNKAVATAFEKFEMHIGMNVSPNDRDIARRLLFKTLIDAYEADQRERQAREAPTSSSREQLLKDLESYKYYFAPGTDLYTLMGRIIMHLQIEMPSHVLIDLNENGVVEQLDVIISDMRAALGLPPPPRGPMKRRYIDVRNELRELVKKIPRPVPPGPQPVFSVYHPAGIDRMSGFPEAVNEACRIAKRDGWAEVLKCVQRYETQVKQVYP